MPVKVVKRKDILNTLTTEVGVKVGYPKETTGPNTYKSGFTLAYNALTQIYGSQRNNIPPRDFVGEGLNQWEQDWYAEGAGKAYLKSVQSNNPTIFAEALGVSLQGYIREAITNTSWPSNAPATIARKGSSQPLIDSGDLRRGLDYITRGTK